MERVPECELMLDTEQARVYADADFTEPNSRFVALLRDRLIDLPRRGRALDLGCGPADVTIRLARSLPDWTLDGVDGSDAMLAFAHDAVRRAGLASRVRLHHAVLTDAPPCGRGYDLVLSNSVLHHLGDPADLWRSVRAALVPGGQVFVMDLFRPESRERARALVDAYAKDEPEVLRSDFYNSLLAAYHPHEVCEQLVRADLEGLSVEEVSDRHFVVFGRIP